MVVGTGAFAQAEVDQRMADEFASRIAQETEVVSASVNTCSQYNLSSMPLADINLDLTPSVIFGINHGININVATEIDLVFVPTTATSVQGSPSSP